MPDRKPPLSTAMIGSWQLTTREDHAADGRVIRESALGADPLGLLIYDRGGNFAAQFMRRDRSGPAAMAPVQKVSGANNTMPTDGYDAYFGTYTADDAAGTVTQTLVAALSRENVGQVVTRDLAVDGDTLTVSLGTTLPDGTPVTRILKWARVG
ncbi:MAG: lipocalin-like domain-containing protein [Hyphomonas sp.]